MTEAIVATGLRHRFGETQALDGVDLAVPQGTVLAMLGPNGAGKTTTVRVLTTQLVPDEGAATVLGHDVRRDAPAVRRSIGMAGQYAAVDERLTGRENLVMVARLNGFDRPAARRRTTALLDEFQLADAGDRPVRTYSGGMRRRLDLAAALVARPPVLFLDEPTTGLDPRSRADLWGVIERLVADGATLLLTTQYLEEADRLADEIVVIDHGRVVARGTGEELKRSAGSEVLTLTFASDAEAQRAMQAVTTVDGVQTEASGIRLVVRTPDLAPLLAAVTARLTAAGCTPTGVDLRRPTLDDVFLQLTGTPAGTDVPDALPAS